MLSSGTHITPHNSATNYFLTAHLGLKIPKTEDKNNSYLRVADQTVHWENGKLIIFDESFNHEAKVYFSHNMLEIQMYRREILTFQLEREKLFRFSHIAYAYVVKTE